MSESSEINIDIQILSGEQTPITDSVVILANEIKGEGEELITNTSNYLKNFLKPVDSNTFDSQRSVDEIIESKTEKGCHEVGAVFVSFLRAKGLEASYIQAFLKEDIENYNTKSKNNRIRSEERRVGKECRSRW